MLIRKINTISGERQEVFKRVMTLDSFSSDCER